MKQNYLCTDCRYNPNRRAELTGNVFCVEAGKEVDPMPADQGIRYSTCPHRKKKDMTTNHSQIAVAVAQAFRMRKKHGILYTDTDIEVMEKRVSAWFPEE